MNFSRRNFLKAGAIAGTPLILPNYAFAAAEANEKLTMGFIGLGIQGRSLLDNFLWRDLVITAVSDVDTNRREDALRRVDAFYTKNPERGKPGNCKAYNDYREILARKDIDVVCIATPDHWHAIMTIETLRAGKDVYCEKPLTYNVAEAVAVMQVAKETGRIIQTGAMQRSGVEFRTAAELVRNGVIGKVKTVDCMFGGPSKPHTDPAQEQAMEPGLDWDRWCGPAPLVKYNPELSPRGVHDFFPMVWRMDDLFGTGYCGDWGAHHLDIAQWGLDMDSSGPVKMIKADRKDSNKRSQSGAQMIFADGVVLTHKPFGEFGAVFSGTDGVVSVNRDKFEIIRDGQVFSRFSKKEDGGSLESAVQKARKEFLKDAKVKLYATKGGHLEDFVACCKSRQQPCSPAEVGARSAILCQLFNTSYVEDAGFDWDPVRNIFANGTGNPAWRTRNYRDGYTLKV